MKSEVKIFLISESPNESTNRINKKWAENMQESHVKIFTPNVE